MEICVIGGSGFVGTHLIREIKDWHEITILDKNMSATFPELVLKGDIRDKKFLEEHLDGFDLVIHLAAEHKDNVSPTSLYYDVNVGGMYNLLEAMDQNGIKNIIFTSSVAIYGLNKDNPDENHEPDPFNHYGKSKWQAEQVLQEWYSDSSDKSVSIIRPTVIFGEENRGNVYNLLKQIVSGKFMMVGKGNNKKSMAYVKNITGFIQYLIQNNSNGYQVYNYVDKPDLSTKELIKNIESALSVSVPSLRIPYWLGLMGGYGFDLLAAITGKKFPISSVRIKKFCATTQFDASKAHNTDFNAPYTIEEGLERTLQYEFGEKTEEEVLQTA